MRRPALLFLVSLGQRSARGAPRLSEQYKYASQAVSFRPTGARRQPAKRSRSAVFIEKASGASETACPNASRLPRVRTHSPGEQNRKKTAHLTADHRTAQNARTAHQSHNTVPEGPIEPSRRVPGPTVQSCCRKQSVWRRQSTAKQAAPPSRGSPQHPKRWPTARSWRPRARPIKARRPSKQHKGCSTADAVAPQVVRFPDHGRQFECGLRVQLTEGRGPETGKRHRGRGRSRSRN